MAKGKILVKARAATDVGLRMNNEDAYLINEDLGLFVVADGMGGHEKGEVASWFTSESLENIIGSVAVGGEETLRSFDEESVIEEDVSVDDERMMEYAIMSINKRLHEQNEKEVEKADANLADALKKRKCMATTLVSLLIHSNRAYITHVGDSRAYRIARSSIQQLTHDHSWVEERIRLGELTPKEAKTHKKRNVITRSLGFKPEVEADIDVFTLCPPERFLLCSDGLSNVVKEADLLELGQMDDLSLACEQMVELAKANRGQDNITAVLIDISMPPKKDQEEASTNYEETI